MMLRQRPSYLVLATMIPSEEGHKVLVLGQPARIVGERTTLVEWADSCFVYYDLVTDELVHLSKEEAAVFALEQML